MAWANGNPCSESNVDQWPFFFGGVWLSELRGTLDGGVGIGERRRGGEVCGVGHKWS